MWYSNGQLNASLDSPENNRNNTIINTNTNNNSNNFKIDSNHPLASLFPSSSLSIPLPTTSVVPSTFPVSQKIPQPKAKAVSFPYIPDDATPVTKVLVCF